MLEMGRDMGVAFFPRFGKDGGTFFQGLEMM